MTAFPKIHYFCTLRNIFSETMSIHLLAPERIDARIQLPSSKSICNRALILNALSGSKWPLGNLSDCDDTRVMVRAFEEGGPDFDIMAAGTAMRFLTAYLAQCEGVWTITGSERMRHRPIRLLVDALRSLGARNRLLGRRRFPSAADLWKDVGGGAVDAECRSQFAIYIGLAYGSPLYAGRTYIVSCRRDDLKTLYNDDAQYDEAVGYG